MILYFVAVFAMTSGAQMYGCDSISNSEYHREETHQQTEGVAEAMKQLYDALALLSKDSPDDIWRPEEYVSR